MSIISALYAGASGMSAMSKSIQVIGNNIANVNTVGFKGSRAEFADLLSQSINTPAGKKQVGRGVRVEAIQGLFSQGSFQSTSVVTDMAINGSGYFVLTDGNEKYFSRAGQFRVDSLGNLTNAVGMNVNGYLYDRSGQPTGAMGPINLSSATTPPNPTGDGVTAGSGIALNLNLDSREAVKTFDIKDPSGTSNFSSSVTVYDSLGAPHTTVLYFNKTANNAWAWHGVVDGGELTGGTAGTPQEVAGGTLTFDTNGAMTAATTSTSSFSFTGGATPSQAIGFDFTGTTQVATPSITNSLTQDGYAAGAIQAIDVDKDGIITGVFSNGRTRPIAQLAIATFPSEVGLNMVGNSLFGESAASGQPIYGAANSGTNGSIASSTVELSNVDLTEEFINLITTERAYQANSKVITTGDTLLDTTINMLR